QQILDPQHLGDLQHGIVNSLLVPSQISGAVPQLLQHQGGVKLVARGMEAISDRLGKLCYRGLPGILSLYQLTAAGGLLAAVEILDNGCLARAVPADDGEKFPLMYVQVGTVEHLHLRDIAKAQVLDLDNRLVKAAELLETLSHLAE